VEKAAYAKNIIVLWQPKAWVDREVAIQHVKALAPWFKKHVRGDSIIGCDNLDAQIQLRFYKEVRDALARQLYASFWRIDRWIPGGR
jgi:hypothetical protein